MARSLHLHMVAEGVETEPQSIYLLKHGVRYGQGWHFGRPMDLDHLCERIRACNEPAPDLAPLVRGEVFAR